MNSCREHLLSPRLEQLDLLSNKTGNLLLQFLISSSPSPYLTSTSSHLLLMFRVLLFLHLLFLLLLFVLFSFCFCLILYVVIYLHPLFKAAGRGQTSGRSVTVRKLDYFNIKVINDTMPKAAAVNA